MLSLHGQQQYLNLCTQYQNTWYRIWNIHLITKSIFNIKLKIFKKKNLFEGDVSTSIRWNLDTRLVHVQPLIKNKLSQQDRYHHA